MRPIRVLHVLSGYLPDRVTGTAQRVRGLMLPLVRSGKCEVQILRPGVNGSRHETVEGVSVHHTGGGRITPWILRSAVKQLGIDIVHCHNLQDYMTAMLSVARLPLVAEAHSLWEPGSPKRLLYLLMYRHCRRLVVLASSMGQELQRQYGIQPQKLALVHNGVDLELFSPGSADREAVRAELDITEQCVVGFVGSFQPWQGLDTLIEAFAMLHQQGMDARLLLVGDGPGRPALEDQIHRHGLQGRVTITGFVPQADAARYLGCMDIFVVPRPSTLETETALPLKVLEGMAAGLPVVVSRVAGLTAVIQDGHTGRVAPPGDSKALAETMTELLRDDDQRRRLGEAARQCVMERFNWEKSAQALYEAYLQALAT